MVGCEATAVSADRLLAESINHLGRIVADAVLKNDLHFFDVADIGRWVAANHNQIRDFPRRERSHLVELAEKFRTIRRGDVDSLERRETCFHEQLHFALVAKSGDDAAVAGWVESREKQSARLNERALEVQLLLKQNGPTGRRCPIGDSCATRE